MTTLTTMIEPVGSRATFTCAHCAQPVPAGLVERDVEHQFCCAGCRAVYEAIHACGLDSYYKLRAAAQETFSPVAPGRHGFAAFDSPTFHALYVQPAGEGALTVDLMLEGVTCAACVWLVEKLPEVLPGVIEARLSLRQATVRVTWDGGRIKLSQIAQLLDCLGYVPHAAKGVTKTELHYREERRRLIALGVSGALMGNTMLLGLALYAGMFGGMEGEYVALFRWLSLLLGMLSLAWPGAVFFKSAISAIRMRAINLDVPIALALLAGGAAGTINVLLGRGEIYFDSLTVLVFLLLVGRFLQFRQQRRADAAVDLLFSLTPSTCRIVDGETITETPIEALKVNEVVEVRSGDLLPADGTIVLGRSSVNQSLLTGESRPTAVGVGDYVFGGSQNNGAPIRVRVAKVGESTRIGKLLQLVEQGVHVKPQIVQFTDRVGAWFVLAVSLAAVATFAIWSRRDMVGAIDHTVALLIVTCPCVLGLATPLTLAVAIGKLARRNVLVKSGVAIEKLSKHARLILDKTGTITRGDMRITNWTGDEAIKPIVAEIERHSTHPIARAMAASLTDSPTAGRKARVTNVVERGNGGITAQLEGATIAIGSPRFVQERGIAIEGNLAEAIEAAGHRAQTAVVIAVDWRAIAVAELGDELRQDSACAVAALSRMGLDLQIASGDADAVVKGVAGQVGIATARGQLQPEQKLAIVGNKPADRLTLMVGDGVNDAAALAAADVGIAVHGGAEASLAAADVYIASPGLMPVVELIYFSRRTMAIIRRNLLVSLAYNLLAGTLAAAGMMSPLIAAIIMPVSSATVLSLAVGSLQRIKPKGGR